MYVKAKDLDADAALWFHQMRSGIIACYANGGWHWFIRLLLFELLDLDYEVCLNCLSFVMHNLSSNCLNIDQIWLSEKKRVEEGQTSRGFFCGSLEMPLVACFNNCQLDIAMCFKEFDNSGWSQDSVMCACRWVAIVVGLSAHLHLTDLTLMSLTHYLHLVNRWHKQNRYKCLIKA